MYWFALVFYSTSQSNQSVLLCFVVWKQRRVWRITSYSSSFIEYVAYIILTDRNDVLDYYLSCDLIKSLSNTLPVYIPPEEEKSPPPTSAIHIKSSVTLFGSNIISNSSNTHLLRSPPMDVSIPKKSFSSSPDTFGYNTMNENSNQDSNDSIAIYNELTEIDLHRMHLNILYNIIVMNIGVTGVHFLSSLLSSGVWNHLSVIYLGCILSLRLWIL